MRAAFFEARGYAALAALSITVTAPAVATACSCVEDTQVRLLTATDRPLPRNPQIRLSVPHDGVFLPEMQPGDHMARPEELRIGVRELPAGAEPKLSERRLPAGSGTLLLLSPQAPLRARARYEVFVAHGKQRTSLGQLQIGDSEDRVAPSLGAIDKTVYLPADRTNVRNGSCQTGDATVTLKLAPLTDSGEKKGALYLLWLAKGDLAVDFQTPPNYGTLLSADKDTIQIGRSHLCGRGFRWRPAPNQTELRIGIIAYDEAGNASAPVEHRAPLVNQ